MSTAPLIPHSPRGAVLGMLAAVAASLTVAFFVLSALAMLVTAPPSHLSSVAQTVVLIASAVTLWFFARIMFLTFRLGRDSVPFPSAVGQVALRGASFLYVPIAIGVGGAFFGAAGWLGGAAFATLGLPILRALRNRNDFLPRILRGTSLMNFEQARRLASKLPHDGFAPIAWGPIMLPEHCAEGHFCLVGATGSGKTVSIRLLMQSILPRIQSGCDHRVLIYDAKQDAMSLLSGMGITCPIVLLNPFDGRSAAWDMARDMTEPATAFQVASIVVQDERGENSFFAKAARDLLGHVLLAFMILAPKRWTLRDVLLTMGQRARMKRLLMSLPQTAHMVEEYFARDPRTTANILQTVSANVGMLRPIAALWSHSPTRIALEDWINGRFILVLGNEERFRSPLDAVNRVIFQRLTELVIAQSESTTRRTWIFLDELKEAGNLEGLSRLLTKGRSKGARIVVGFQDIEGLRSVYGPHLANEIVGMCANKALLRTDSPETAQWAGHVIGEYEGLEYTRGWSKTKSGTFGQPSNESTSESTTEHIVKREAVLASQIMRLPPADARRFFAYYVTPAIGVYETSVWFSGALCGRGPMPNFIPRPPSDQHLIDWTPEDVERLGPDFLKAMAQGPAQPGEAAIGLDDIDRVSASEESAAPDALLSNHGQSDDSIHEQDDHTGRFFGRRR